MLICFKRSHFIAASVPFIYLFVYVFVKGEPAHTDPTGTALDTKVEHSPSDIWDRLQETPLTLSGGESRYRRGMDGWKEYHLLPSSGQIC